MAAANAVMICGAGGVTAGRSSNVAAARPVVSKGGAKGAFLGFKQCHGGNALAVQGARRAQRNATKPAMAAIADTKEAATEEKEVELKSDVRSLSGFKHHNPKKTLSSRPPGLAPPLDGLLARRRGRPLRVGGGLGAPFSGVHVWAARSYSRSQGTVI